MGNKQSTAARNRISQLETELSSTRNALSSTQNALSSTQNELKSTNVKLSSTMASLRESQQKVEKLTKDNALREILVTKLSKVGELQEQVHSTKFEALSSKFMLEVSRKEEEELKEQLIARKKFQDDIEMKVKVLMEMEKQISFVNDEMLSTMSSLKASKNEENMLKEQLLTQDKVQKDMEMKLEVIRKLEKQLSQTKNEALSMKHDFEASKMEENMLEEQLESFEKFNQDIEMKLRKVMEVEKQIMFSKAEGLFVKANLQALRKQEEGLKKQLLEFEKYQKDMEIKLEKIFELEQEISLSEVEALSTMDSLENSKNEVEKLKEKLLALEKVQQAMEELRVL